MRNMYDIRTRYGHYVNSLSYALCEDLWNAKRKKNEARLLWRYYTMRKEGESFYFAPRQWFTVGDPVKARKEETTVRVDPDNTATILADPHNASFTVWPYALIRIANIIGHRIRPMRARFRSHKYHIRMLYRGDWVPFRGGMRFDLATGELLTPELAKDDPKLYVNRAEAKKARERLAPIMKALPIVMSLDGECPSWEERYKQLETMDPHNISVDDVLASIHTLPLPWNIRANLFYAKTPTERNRTLLANSDYLVDKIVRKYVLPKVENGFIEVREENTCM